MIKNITTVESHYDDIEKRVFYINLLLLLLLLLFLLLLLLLLIM